MGRILLLLPYLLFTRLVWFFDTHGRGENVCDEIAPGLWLGRWPTARDLPAGVAQIVDLTLEFGELRRVRDGRQYLLLPTLDATPHEKAAAQHIARLVAGSNAPTYLHCALGHGRSALLAALIMIERGDAADADEAVARLQRIGPGVKLNAAQLTWLQTTAHPWE